MPPIAVAGRKSAEAPQDDKGYWIPGPLWWAWNCTSTFDNHWMAKGLKGPHRTFPRLPYLASLFSRLLTDLKEKSQSKPPKVSVVFVPKSREMMASWSVVAYCTWFCQLFPATRVLIQAQKADKACELVRGTEPPGYARTLYEQQDDWLKRRFPLVMRMEDLSSDKVVWENQSAIQAVPREPIRSGSFTPPSWFLTKRHTWKSLKRASVLRLE